MLLVHVVFSTKGRLRMIDSTLKPRLHAYLGGIVLEEGATAHIINGVEDHVHMLIDLPASRALADLLRVVKTNSSRWVHDLDRRYAAFAWLSGYGAFSVSRSKFDEVSAYIMRQEEHHRTRTFEEEYLAMLRRHGIEFDERFVVD
ncbi:MAG: transposase [Planctomycetota bacterium]|nr:MAG: transposase [Planctomycetota bacterium]MCQ3921774.1 transposase [Planctomycetota bacterium]